MSLPQTAKSILPHAQVTIVAYGHEGHSEIEMCPQLPSRDLLEDKDALNRWIHEFAHAASMDVKHSNNWNCQFCGLPARETNCYSMSYPHLDPPKMTVYIRFMCNQENPPCKLGLEMTSRMMTVASGHTRPPANPFRVRPGPPPKGRFPLAASCCYCKAEMTTAMNLRRCAGCKLTRYCGPQCQRADWQRHRAACKAVTSVGWCDPSCICRPESTHD